jgi:hypothetical protein
VSAEDRREQERAEAQRRLEQERKKEEARQQAEAERKRLELETAKRAEEARKKEQDARRRADDEKAARVTSPQHPQEPQRIHGLDVPRSSANPAHHFAGSFMLIVAAFLFVFGTALMAQEGAVGLVLLIPAAGMVATGVGTIVQQEWARYVGTFVCLIGALAAAFFMAVGISALWRSIDGGWVWIAIPACCAVLAICFAVSFIYYARRWSSWATKLPGGDGNAGAFLSVLLFLDVLTIGLLFAIGSYRYSPVYSNAGAWLAVLVVADLALSAICYARFRKEFGGPP